MGLVGFAGLFNLGWFGLFRLFGFLRYKQITQKKKTRARALKGKIEENEKYEIMALAGIILLRGQLPIMKNVFSSEHPKSIFKISTSDNQINYNSPKPKKLTSKKATRLPIIKQPDYQHRQTQQKKKITSKRAKKIEPRNENPSIPIKKHIDKKRKREPIDLTRKIAEKRNNTILTLAKKFVPTNNFVGFAKAKPTDFYKWLENCERAGYLTPTYHDDLLRAYGKILYETIRLHRIDPDMDYLLLKLSHATAYGPEEGLQKVSQILAETMIAFGVEDR